MLRRLNHLSINTRLILIVVVSSLLALLIVLGAFAVRDSHESRTEFLARNLLLAEVIAKNSRGALAFGDSVRAARTLATLDAEPAISLAALYTVDTDRALAVWPADKTPPQAISMSRENRHAFTEQHLAIQVPVMLDREQQLGQLHVQISTAELQQRIVDDIVALLMIGLITSILVVFFVFYLQKSVSRRFTMLAHLADHVSKGGSYREYPIPGDFGKDEIGAMGNAFIGMLAKLEEREADITDSENRYRTLVESAPFSIFELDLSSFVLSSNRKGVFSRLDTTTQPVRQALIPLMSRADRARIQRQWNKVLNGESVEFDLDIKLDDKLVNTNTSLLPLRDDQGEIRKIMGITQNITQRVSLEGQLRQAQKMEIVGQMTGGVCHDLNNILGVMVGNLELMQLLPNDSAKRADNIANIKHAIDRAATLTRQLLGTTRIKPFNLKLVELNETIRQQGHLWESSLTPHVEVSYALSDPLWPTTIDPADFENAMLNLIVNARDAMSGKGTLRISTRNTVLDHQFSQHGVGLKKGEYVEVCVADDGEGMTQEVRERMFEPFFTTKRLGHGTGLGLAMVFGFIQRSKGGVSVDSRPGEGTRISLYLPRSDADRATPGTMIETSADEVPTAEGETILLVDDQPAILKSVAKQLAMLEYEVVATADIDEAKRLLGSSRRIDLLLSDVIMSAHTNGFELAEYALQHATGIKVLLMSGYSSTNVPVGSANGLALEILQKPFGYRDLAKAVRKALEAD